MSFSQEFEPTPAMQLAAWKRSQMGEVLSDKAIADATGIWPETFSRWKQIKGFNQWFDEQVAVYRAPVLDMLEQVAKERVRDYRYWEALAIKFGYITEGAEDPGKGREPTQKLTTEELISLIAAVRGPSGQKEEK